MNIKCESLCLSCVHGLCATPDSACRKQAGGTQCLMGLFPDLCNSYEFEPGRGDNDRD